MLNLPVSHSGESRGTPRRTKGFGALATLAIAALSCTALANGIAAADEEDAGERFATWTAANGVSLSAELIGTDGRAALLRMEADDRLFSVPLERLQASDRERALAGDVLRLPELDFSRAPSPSQIGALLRRGTQEGWFPLAAHLQTGLLAAYRGEFGPSAHRWYLLYRWIDLFQENPFHADLVPESGRFGENWPPELMLSVCRDAGFSEEFFELISPHDRMDEVSRILATLHRANPEAFEEYKSLALAIAVVHDQQPPRHWPLSVPDGLLPSNLMPPEDAFAFFVSSHRAGRLLMDPRRMPARKLKFMVDLIAPEEELHWAQQTIRPSVGQFGRTYSSVRYNYDRYGSHLPNFTEPWPHDDYRLQSIRRLGGICGDQSYFATQVGKALGLPTIYFSGYGDNGRHAWMGYFEGATRGWNLDVGRYAQNNYRTGYARDPQTWRTIDDHELHFRQHYLHQTRNYRTSRRHSTVAREFLLAGRETDALSAARRAIDAERRNREAWNLVAEINKGNGRTAAYENTLRQAADAFAHHPHVRAHYHGRLADHLLEREAFDEALDLLFEISRDNRRDRPDLSIRYARRFLEHARETGEVRDLVNAYREILSLLRGHVSGSNFLQEIAMPFLNHLHEDGHTNEARILFSQTRRQLNVPVNTLAAHRLEQLNRTLR